MGARRSDAPDDEELRSSMVGLPGLKTSSRRQLIDSAATSGLDLPWDGYWRRRTTRAVDPKSPCGGPTPRVAEQIEAVELAYDLRIGSLAEQALEQRD
jgi:hypothetical protein